MRKEILVWGWIGMGTLMGLAGCSSKTVKVDVEAPDFKVLEAAPGGRESWLDNPQMYADDHSLGIKENYFYSGEAKSADKRMACEKALANVVDDVAKQVATFVDTSIARATSESSVADSSGTTPQGQVSEETQRMSSQLSKTGLGNLIMKKTYWERRDFSQSGGAKNIYFCWTLVSVDKKNVNDMVQKAASMRLNANPELKDKVGEKMKNMDQSYENYQKSH